jgi:hypothetical protein
MAEASEEKFDASIWRDLIFPALKQFCALTGQVSGE